MPIRKPLAEVLAVGLLVVSAGCGGPKAAPIDAAGSDTSGGDDAEAGSDSGTIDSSGGGDLVVIAGGMWPDSATGTCAGEAGVIACPANSAALYGQDGTYRVAVPSYTVTVDTVADTVTGLMWERIADGTLRTYADADARCAARSLAGFDDWRLPTRLELVSLLDHGRATGGALPAAFAAASGGAHWTSSMSGLTATTYYFVVNDAYGIWSMTFATNTLNSRCVRGTGLTGTKQVGTDTVVDTLTGLEWQRSALDDTEITWAAALAYCEALVHAGHNDWRLPNLKELATIVDESASMAPFIDQAQFGTSAATMYWSSSPSLLFPGYANALQTSSGISPNRDMTLTASARCVRQAG
jgi:hypothetical protein